MLAHPFFAVDASNTGHSTLPIDGLNRFLWGIDFVVREDWTYVGITRVTAQLAGRVCHHRFDLLRDFFRRIGKRNIVSITLAHLAAIQPWQPGNWREQGLRLRKNLAIV